MAFLVNSAPWEQWEDAYEEAYVSPAGATGIACPNCGALELRLVFTTRGNRDRGLARMWCEHCLNGIFLAPVPIPGHAEAPNEGEAHFPNFTLVSPGFPGG
jgi:hypothetical protein